MSVTVVSASLRGVESTLTERAAHLEGLVTRHQAEARAHVRHRQRPLARTSLARRRVCARRLEQVEAQRGNVARLREALEMAAVQAEVQRALTAAQRCLADLERQRPRHHHTHDTFIATTQEVLDAINSSAPQVEEDELLAELEALTATDHDGATEDHRPVPAALDSSPHTRGRHKLPTAPVPALHRQPHSLPDNTDTPKHQVKNKKKQKPKVSKEKAKLQGLQTSV